jgi:cytochrome c oxidase cbb3-type subunit III
MSQSGEQQTIHSYDGIQEYDNPLPGWWKWLFVGTFVFSIFYWMYFHTGAETQRSVYTAYDEAVAANLKQQFSELGELKPDNATLMKYVDDKRWLKVGESVYKQHCVSCHGPDAGGLVGPNLCDVYWKNVKVIDDIAKILENGAGNGAMPAWKTRLHPNELVLVACYIASLRGSTPAKARAPEGNEIGPWTLTSAPASEATPPASEAK